MGQGINKKNQMGFVKMGWFYVKTGLCLMC